MRLLHVTPEILPFMAAPDAGSAHHDAGTMSRQLAAALSDMGHDVAVIAAVSSESPTASTVARRVTPVRAELSGEELEIDVLEAGLHRSHARLLLLVLPPRPGIVLDDDLVPTADSLQKQSRWTAALGSAAVRLIDRLGLNPDVVHLHAEAAALALLWGNDMPQDPPAIVLTFYDPQRDASFPVEPFASLVGVPFPGPDPETGQRPNEPERITAAQIAVERADAVTLPSNGARRQISFSRRRLCLKSALANHPNVAGIMGAVDAGRFNPADDPDLAAGFTADNVEGKAACKRALQQRAGMAPRSDALLAVAAPGLSSEDGADLLAETAEDILDLDVQLVLLGSGPPAAARRFGALAVSQNQRMAVFNENAISPQAALAGADLTLSGATWAPWGRLVQAGQRFGAVPVVHAVGGLDDLVVDWDPRTRTGNGFKFRPATVGELVDAIKRARETFADPDLWATVIRNNMTVRHTWNDTARRYAELYHAITAGRD